MDRGFTLCIAFLLMPFVKCGFFMFIFIYGTFKAFQSIYYTIRYLATGRDIPANYISPVVRYCHGFGYQLAEMPSRLIYVVSPDNSIEIAIQN